jgi:hypothetical protein
MGRILLPMRRKTRQRVAVLVQHPAEHLRFGTDGKQSFRKIRRVVGSRPATPARADIYANFPNAMRPVMPPLPAPT